jgi:hypothetical protein
MPFLHRLASALKRGFRTLLPTCRQVSRLQSDALDRPIGLWTRLGLGFHLLVCRWCRRYGRQLRFLRTAAHDHPEQLTQATPTTLSAEARERLKSSLRNESK